MMTARFVPNFAAMLTALLATAGPPGADDPSAWRDLLGFRPSAAVQRAVIARGPDWAVHRIEDAAGPVNLDAYTIEVDALPRLDGRPATPAGLLAYVRTHFPEFTDPALAAFAPLTEADRTAWLSGRPEGAILLIDMKVAGLSPDSGCVVVARSRPDEWIFSTVRAGAPGMAAVFRRDIAAAHPVSGNRAFGWTRRPGGGYLFYTAAADRPTRRLDATAQRLVFSAADRLWRDYQARLSAFINARGGRARIGPARATRHDWAAIRDSPAYEIAGQPAWVRIRPSP